MQGVVFDIDGTLIDSFAADCELFVAAVRKVLGVTQVDTNWAGYLHVSDQGILREIMRRHGIPARPELFTATRVEFVASLRRHIQSNGPFREIPGAIRYLSRLLASGEHFVAYATGAWRESALVKLSSAGFPTRGIALSTSSEFDDRVSIMQGAVATAPAGIDKFTYYGDGVWDREAARELGWDFVAVGEALGGLRDYDAPPG